MIGYLSGNLLKKDANTVIIDVNGVGYEVTIPLSTFYDLGEIGEPVELRIYTYVREDTLQLFGFKTLREKELYLKLISVQGIGAKSGISMLSGMSSDEIIVAIRTDDFVRLTSIPGVGKKTAERIVIELRDKLDDLKTGETVGTMIENAKPLEAVDAVYDDALSALVNLGYQQNKASKALKKAVQEGTEMSVQKLLRTSLQILAKGK